MTIGITTDPANWQAGEAIVWGAVDAALDYDLQRLQRHSDKLDEVLDLIDGIMGIETIEEEPDRLSFNAEIVLRRIKGEKIRMDTDRHLAGLTELARRGLIVKKSRGGWRAA